MSPTAANTATRSQPVSARPERASRWLRWPAARSSNSVASSASVSALSDSSSAADLRASSPDLPTRCGWALLMVLMLAVSPVALNRGINHLGGTDFPEYYAAGRYLLEHGAIQPHAMTAYYLPSLDVMWAGVAWFPLPVAAVLWYALGCYAWIALLRDLDRYWLCELPLPARRHAVIATGLLVAPLVLDQLCIGAFHGLMLWWMISGMGRVLRGKPWSGAILLGLAIWIKLLPALGAAYLLYKRRWREALLAAMVAGAVDLSLTAIALPLEQNLAAHREWWEKDAAGTAELLLSSPVKVNEQRVTNQSLPAVLRRILTQLGYPSNSSRDLAAIANLTPGQLKLVYFSVLGAIGLALLWIFRRSARNTPPAAQATEMGLVILATLWFTPIAPSYHPIAVAPALALILGREHLRPIAWLTAALWTGAMILHASPLARAFGHVLWVTFLLAGILLWTNARQREKCPATAVL